MIKCFDRLAPEFLHLFKGMSCIKEKLCKSWLNDLVKINYREFSHINILSRSCIFSGYPEYKYYLKLMGGVLYKDAGCQTLWSYFCTWLFFKRSWERTELNKQVPGTQCLVSEAAASVIRMPWCSQLSLQASAGTPFSCEYFRCFWGWKGVWRDGWRKTA